MSWGQRGKHLTFQYHSPLTLWHFFIFTAPSQKMEEKCTATSLSPVIEMSAIALQFKMLIARIPRLSVASPFNLSIHRPLLPFFWKFSSPFFCPSLHPFISPPLSLHRPASNPRLLSHSSPCLSLSPSIFIRSVSPSLGSRLSFSPFISSLHPFLPLSELSTGTDQ